MLFLIFSIRNIADKKKKKKEKRKKEILLRGEFPFGSVVTNLTSNHEDVG